jgi:hypothetical protein
MDKNLGAEENGKLLSVDENGDIVTAEIDSLELITVDEIDEICVITEILPKTTLVFETYTVQDTVRLSLPEEDFPEFKLEIGSTYNVVLDNKVYECVCWDNGSGDSVIGDKTFYSTNTWGDSGLPFIVWYFIDISGRIYRWFRINSTETTHTVAIYKIGN